jgi:prepilin-type processing-associated H-X9-DG protein
MGDLKTNPERKPIVLEYATPRPRAPIRFSWVKLVLMLLVAIAVAAVAAAILLPPLNSGGRPPARRVVCLSNLRQLDLAIVNYANSNKGYLPPNLAVLLPYTSSTRLFVCPSSKDMPPTGSTTRQIAASLLNAPGHCSYTYLGGGLRIGKIKDPAHFILLYETVSNHAGYVNVGFADGHVESLTSAAAASMLAAQSGLGSSQTQLTSRPGAPP